MRVERYVPCEPSKKGAYPEDWITQQITQYANVQTQTTVHCTKVATARDSLVHRESIITIK